ncbi:hypothetical protein Syun_025351 [Stephania yunnanensis]|uniref:Uncharacterized protein n=1 Tax=Stephania yunnanensis TaxID=152371 RepID=A0AAP0ES17_9MAGN
MWGSGKNGGNPQRRKKGAGAERCSARWHRRLREAISGTGGEDRAAALEDMCAQRCNPRCRQRALQRKERADRVAVNVDDDSGNDGDGGGEDFAAAAKGFVGGGEG